MIKDRYSILTLLLPDQLPLWPKDCDYSTPYLTIQITAVAVKYWTISSNPHASRFGNYRSNQFGSSVVLLQFSQQLCLLFRRIYLLSLWFTPIFIFGSILDLRSN